MKSYLEHSIRQPALVGRGEQTSIDMAVKKYHNDIGSRLSDMHVSSQYRKDECLLQDFCMLTIDKRHLRKQKENASQALSVSRVLNSSDDSGLELSTTTSPYTASSKSVNSITGHSQDNHSARTTTDQENNSSRGKRHLFDKLTCLLFLRKHMCARCKRRSRSCVSNKAFIRSEKRYMCFKCRDASHAFKNMCIGHSNCKDSLPTHSSQDHSLFSGSKKRTTHISQKNGKDSGYDTVTSCSTVASTVSAFGTPANIRQKNNKEKNTAKPVLFGDFCHIPNTHKYRHQHSNNGIKCTQDLRVLGVYSELDISSETTADSESELSNFQVDDNAESIEDKLTQVRTRDVQRDIPQDVNKTSTWKKSKLRPALSDTSNIDGVSENGDYCFFPPRIIRVTQTAKSTIPTEKACYTCDSTTKPCFRLPWAGGWICEDCLDGLH